MSLVEQLTAGSMVVAVPVAMLAGAVSFASPCVLPLVPGYVSYMAGVSGAGARGDSGPGRGRVLVGTAAFILGVAVVFVSFGAAFGGAGQLLIRHQRALQVVMGGIVIVLGAMFAGLLPGLQREFRMHRAPTRTVAGAGVLGVLFALGWTPCIGPALAAVQTLAFTEASAGRGAVLGFAFCLGLGVPFLVIGQLMDRGIRAVSVLRRHSSGIMRAGGLLLMAIGVAEVTGWWQQVTIALRVWGAGWTVPL